jgi:hypothetical protein
MLHVDYALGLGWSLPQLVGPGLSGGPASSSSSSSSIGGNGGSSDLGSVNNSASSSVSGAAASDGAAAPCALVLRGAWPYWMDRHGGSAEGVSGQEVVANDVELAGMALLTGPNMAGEWAAVAGVGRARQLGAPRC